MFSREVPANFDEDRWVKAWEMRPGNPAVVHHVIVYVRPPQQPAAAQAAGTTATPRPRGVVSFAEGMEIPAGQTGGPLLPEGQFKPAFPNDRPRPRGTAGSIGGYVPGHSTRVFPEGTGDAAAQGIVTRVPDALHDHRQAHHRPHADGVHLREGAAEDGAEFTSFTFHVRPAPER